MVQYSPVSPIFYKSCFQRLRRQWHFMPLPIVCFQIPQNLNDCALCIQVFGAPFSICDSRQGLGNKIVIWLSRCLFSLSIPTHQHQPNKIYWERNQKQINRNISLLNYVAWKRRQVTEVTFLRYIPNVIYIK